MKFHELDVVKTLVTKDSTPSKSIGTIVHAFVEPREAYMVEFVNSDGETLDTPIYLPDELAAE
jgi:hypothetical protein